MNRAGGPRAAGQWSREAIRVGLGRAARGDGLRRIAHLLRGAADAPTILFCIGAQKAGTSWLYWYLSQHPDCHLRAVKELHYFDAGRDGEDFFANRLRESRDQLKSPGWRWSRSRRRRIAAIDELLAVRGKGAEAYRGFLERGCGGRKVVADITPAYATLDRDEFARMRDLGPSVRFLYFLRDPVSRAWSNARMRSRGQDQAGEPGAAALKVFDEFLDGKVPPIDLRSDYSGTLTRLLDVVPREDVCVAFYEDVVAGNATDQVTDFLRIQRKPIVTPGVVNKGPPYRLDAARAGKAAERLREQYRFVEAFCGGRLPEAWRRSMEV